MIRLASIVLALVLAASAAPALTYEDWIANYPDIASTSPTADPDNDGLVNLFEYALADCNPTVPEPAVRLPEMVFGTRQPDTALPIDDLSVIQFYGLKPPTTGFVYAGLRYKPRANTEGLIWLPQYSWQTAKLASWVDGRAAFLPPTAADGQGRVIRYMAGMFEAERNAKLLFLRLRLVKE